LAAPLSRGRGSIPAFPFGTESSFCRFCERASSNCCWTTFLSPALSLSFSATVLMIRATCSWRGAKTATPSRPLPDL